jgi:hypothetical protein
MLVVGFSSSYSVTLLVLGTQNMASFVVAITFGVVTLGIDFSSVYGIPSLLLASSGIRSPRGDVWRRDYLCHFSIVMSNVISRLVFAKYVVSQAVSRRLASRCSASVCRSRLTWRSEARICFIWVSESAS